VHEPPRVLLDVAEELKVLAAALVPDLPLAAGAVLEADGAAALAALLEAFFELDLVLEPPVLEPELPALELVTAAVVDADDPAGVEPDPEPPPLMTMLYFGRALLFELPWLLPMSTPMPSASNKMSRPMSITALAPGRMIRAINPGLGGAAMRSDPALPVFGPAS
jgi:hypothetical protein